MATYPGMSLRGEVRESISLDEDDLSDVEDEVFIRDGKNGYKLAEEMNVKRPLMAPRRKPGKVDITSRLKSKPPCKVFCKPCCYVFTALSVLIGLIILVVILVSMFPLPIDKLRDWIISKSKNSGPTIKLSPCNNLKVTDVWTATLPKLTTDSPIRILDVNGDGVEDILFGFGTGDNYNILPPDIFCPIFMGVPPPCKGGIIALDGLNGDIIWRNWLNDTIFSLQCTADVNDDQFFDCLAVGMEGTVLVVNSRNGSTLWRLNTGNMNIFVANFIPDQNKDNVSDILASHASLEEGKEGHIILFSGKNGRELRRLRIQNGAKTFYMPQLLKRNSSSMYVLIGTGSPRTPGNLNAISLSDVLSENTTDESTVLYQDRFKGILTQSVLVDLNGDNVTDIVTAMYNSSLVAVDGLTFQQIWNYTIPGPKSETNIVPTPGYFNFDNVTDFLIIYQKYDNILNNNYTQTFIIDGKTGQPIYEPISGSITTQINGLTLSMECHGYDLFLFWTSECTNVELYKKTDMPKENLNTLYDECRRQFNTSSILKLNALNQFHQPPGVLIYNSVNRSAIEFNNTKSAMKQLKEYFLQHPKIQVDQGQSEVDANYNVDSKMPIGIRKYGSSSFRHKDNKNTGIIKDYMGSSTENNPLDVEPPEQKYVEDYDAWPQSQPSGMVEDIESEFNNYNMEEPDTIPYNQKQLYLEENLPKSNSRDPRSKADKAHEANKNDKNNVQDTSTKKKNLSDKKYGIYGYRNIELSKGRLLHDVSNSPTEILRDTFFKNQERQLRKSKFEQRDINSHKDKIKDNAEVRQIIEEEKKDIHNMSLNLWDLESEKEVQDRENGYWRSKRHVNYAFDGITKITSVGAVVDSLNTTNNTNSIDVVFITYWLPVRKGQQETLYKELQECIEDKLAKSSEDKVHASQKTTESEQRALFQSECLAEQGNLKRDFAYFNQIYQLKFGQMTVYRVRIECVCESVNKNERCAKFLPANFQGWPAYLGKYGDGTFQTRN